MSSSAVLYVDTSAFLKLLLTEEHSGALRTVLSTADVWSSQLLGVEAHRGARRARLTPATVDAELDKVTLVLPTEATFNAARSVGSANLRALDALHLASALELGGDLDGLVTYDRRLADGAAELGIDVVGPGLDPSWWIDA